MDPKTQLTELAQGYRQSIVLLTACKLGIFAALGRDRRTANDLAAQRKLDPRALETTLLALAAEGILECHDQSFCIAPRYLEILLPDGDQTQSHIFNHNYNCLQRWCRLAEVLRTGQPVPEPADEPEEDSLRDFICGMADISRVASKEVLEKVDLSPFRKMLDLGGGPATAAIEFARQHPQLSCVVFDLPGAIAIAREEILRAGLTDRIETRIGDYYQDEFGQGFDLVYISNIIHSMAPADTDLIARKSQQALLPGGTVMIKEFFLEDDRTSTAAAAYFSINMLVATEGGKSYTLRETREIFRNAGFRDFRSIDLAADSRLLIARNAGTPTGS